MSDIKSIQLKTSAYPKMVKAFAEENFNLKILSGLLLGVIFLSLILVLYLVKRGPIVIALDGNGEVARVETKVTDLQVEAAVREYLKHRYSWSDGSIASEIAKAKFFIQPSLVAAFEKSMTDVQKFVREKKVSQRVYPKSISVDLKDKKVSILADRITEFDQLKAATELRVTLQFTAEGRSIANPWGIYITKEAEEGKQ
jgi:hypothetical protein